jgi:hypothetical protein
MNEVQTHSVRDFVLTYRYLRVMMIAVLLMLGASVIWQGVAAGCWLGSVSAYYYTPVRNVFVGALFVFGAALIAYHGSTPEEETVLNLSGFTALVVALVPTVPDGCEALPDDAEVTNNIASLAIAAVLALGLIKVINRDRVEPEGNSPAAQVSEKKSGLRAWLAQRWSSLGTWWPDHGQKVLVVVCSIVPPAMFVFFLLGRETFISVAHTLAALTMVFGLILYMIFNAVLADHDRETIRFPKINNKLVLKINYKKVYQLSVPGRRPRASDGRSRDRSSDCRAQPVDLHSGVRHPRDLRAVLDCPELRATQPDHKRRTQRRRGCDRPPRTPVSRPVRSWPAISALAEPTRSPGASRRRIRQGPRLKEQVRTLTPKVRDRPHELHRHYRARRCIAADQLRDAGARSDRRPHPRGRRRHDRPPLRRPAAHPGPRRLLAPDRHR